MSERITYSIPSFCFMYQISRSLFYKLLKEKKGPRLMKIGRRTFITSEAAAEWQSQMEKMSIRNGKNVNKKR